MILSICPNPSIDTFWFLDELRPGESHRISGEERYPGGKGIHVAMAVAELGEPSELLGFWAGATGDWLREECQKLNINCHGPQVDGSNRSCLTLRTDGGKWHDTELLGLGPSLQPIDYQLFLGKYAALLDRASVVVMSGSWPPGAPDDPYGPMIDLANEKGIPVWLDCSGGVLEKALPHRPFGLHLNQKEAAAGLPKAHAGKPEKHYLQFVEMLALTAGKDGLFLSENNSTAHAACRLEKTISAVGSGDCLTAGLAVAKKRDLDLAGMAKLGTACGSANCLRKELGMLFEKDVKKLESAVRVEVFDFGSAAKCVDGTKGA